MLLYLGGKSFLSARHAGRIPENRGGSKCDEFADRATFVLTQRIVPVGADSFHWMDIKNPVLPDGPANGHFPDKFSVTVPGGTALPLEPGKRAVTDVGAERID